MKYGWGRYSYLDYRDFKNRNSNILSLTSRLTGRFDVSLMNFSIRSNNIQPWLSKKHLFDLLYKEPVNVVWHLSPWKFKHLSSSSILYLAQYCPVSTSLYLSTLWYCPVNEIPHNGVEKIAKQVEIVNANRNQTCFQTAKEFRTQIILENKIKHKKEKLFDYTLNPKPKFVATA